jgi:hypothetical protein
MFGIKVTYCEQGAEHFHGEAKVQGVGTSVWILASCQSVVLLLTE